MENLCDINIIKSILSRNGFTFSKSLGQNFIVDVNVCPMMADSVSLSDDDTVIEIGPGIGVLTAELAKRAGKVISYELDKRLLPLLSETLREFDNVQIINEDIMKADLRSIIAENSINGRACVCANLPYYITSPVIMMLLEERLPLDTITVMVQKEAAQRLCAPVGSREGGAVTVAVNYYAEADRLFSVNRESFFPSPKVDSEVIMLKVRERPPVEVSDEAYFFRLVKGAFSQRRKTLQNSLNASLSVPKELTASVLKDMGIAEDIRPERLTMENICELANRLSERK